MRGGRLEVDIRGAQDASTLLLLHAGNAPRTMWDPLLEALSTAHRVITADARGFGGSTPALSAYSGYDDVVTVMDATATDRATLIGASFGGRLALDTALAAPDRCAGLVMIGAVPSGAVPTFTDEEQRLADEADAAEAADDWSRRAELDVDIWSVGPTRTRAQVEPAFLRQAIDRAHRDVALLRSRPSARCRPMEPPAVDRLTELRIPLLSIVGEHDFAFTKAQQRRSVARAGPDASSALIADAAHFPGLEQPHAVLGVLEPWLRTHAL